LTPLQFAQGTSAKGRAAEAAVRWAIENDKLPKYGTSCTDASDAEQLRGIDLLTDMGHSIQVKCDYRGGEKIKGGTGNLFVQVAESNPLKQHKRKA